MITIEEKTHYGHYYNVRQITAKTLSAAVRETFNTSPTNTGTPERTIRAKTRDLKQHGKTDHGWADYQVIPNPQPLTTHA